MENQEKNKPKFHPNPRLSLMDQVREVLRYHHYAYRTEQTYCKWILRYIYHFGGKTHPNMLGAKDVAFPKLNLASYYIYIAGALFAIYSILTGAVDTGWTFYTPYSTESTTSVISMTFAVFILGFSSIFTSIMSTFGALRNMLLALTLVECWQLYDSFFRRQDPSATVCLRHCRRGLAGLERRRLRVRSSPGGEGFVAWRRPREEPEPAGPAI